MAISKGINKGFQSDSEGMKKKEIAMPPLEEREVSVQEETVLQDNTMSQDSVNVEFQPDGIEDSLDATIEERIPEESARKKHSAQESFRAVREAKEKAERERDELMKQVADFKRYQDSLKYEVSHKKEEPIDDDIDFEIQEDDIVEGRYVKKMTNKIKNLEKNLKKYEEQSTQRSIENQIKEQFPDFDTVVSVENVELLNRQFPEIARTLRDTTDLYSKAVSAYNVIKKFGIHRDDVGEEDRIKALRNTQKPRPLSSVNPQQGDSPLSKANAFANGLTEELKEQLRREMNAARKAL